MEVCPYCEDLGSDNAISRVWGAYCDGIGTPIRVIVSVLDAPGCPPKLCSRLPAKPTPDFTDALTAAYLNIASTVGWPTGKSFEVHLQPLAANYPLPRVIDGDSLFGALSLVLAQSAIRIEPGCIRYPLRDLACCIRATALHRVAVTATLDPATGNLSPVECIRHKLDGFCNSDVEDQLHAIGPRVCVIATSQDLNDQHGRCHHDGGPSAEPVQSDPELYHAPFRPVNHSRTFPLLRAYTAVDAFVKLWGIQARGLARGFQ